METFDEKIKKSFGNSLATEELNADIVNYIIDGVINIAIEYDRGAGIDFDDKAKKLTNSLIEKANNSKI